MALILSVCAALLLPHSSLSEAATKEGAGRPVFVLVHGTFQWGGQWAPLAALLNAEGYTTHAPSLTGLGEREHLLSRQVGLTTHVEDITNYITWLDLKNVILVGHSYGGVVITGVADRIGDRIAHGGHGRTRYEEWRWLADSRGLAARPLTHNARSSMEDVYRTRRPEG